MCVTAALFAAFAAWVSFGTIGFDSPGGSRIGLLPVDPAHGLVAIAIGLIVYWALSRSSAIRHPPSDIRDRAETQDARPRCITALAVLPLVLAVLPWLPFPVPAALLAWDGALDTILWVSVAIALVASQIHRRSHGRRVATTFARPYIVGLASLFVFSLAAWFVSPVRPAGDEPHYLIITQSLLYDGDLDIANNHRRGDYRAYFAGELTPDVIRVGRNGGVYSIHAPGVPALILPAFAVGGYRGVVIFLLLLSSAGCVLAWWLAWKVTGSVGAAWFGWAVAALSPPFLLESYTVYPDGPAATLVLTGIWALLRAEWERDRRDASWKPWMLHGAALAALPWMHTRFSVIAATLGGLILLRLARGPNPAVKAIAFLAVPALSAIAWLAFFVVVYGRPDPSAPYGRQLQNSFAFLPNGVGGLFFDQGFGLLATAPVLVFAFAGFRWTRRLGVEWTIVAIPYLLAVTTFAMWWAGWSGPARFFVPLVLPLAIPAACAWLAMRQRGTRATAVAALVVTCWLSAVMVSGGAGHLGYHTRNEGGLTAAPWMEWALPAVDVPSAVPAFVPLPFGTPVAARNAAAREGFIVLFPWLVCFGAAVLTLRALAAHSLRHPAALVATTTLIYAVAASAALGIVWSMRRVAPVNGSSAQMTLLRGLGSDRILALDLTHWRRLSQEQVASQVQIQIPVRRVDRSGARSSQALAAIPWVPAGDYAVAAHRRGGDGWMMVGVGADQFALITQPAAAFDAGLRIRLPVDVRALVVRADEEARQHTDVIEIRPVRLLRRSQKLTTDVARRAVRYGDTSVFFMDDRAFPEPAAFWVGGGRETSVIVAPDRGGSSQPLALRNAPVENAITIVSGRWRLALTLQAGEERRVDVPMDASRGAALVQIRSAAGFRPSEANPESRDSRYLGVYVRVDGVSETEIGR